MNILLLFDRKSITEERAYPDRLLALLQSESGSIKYSYAVFDELIYRISNAKVSVTVSGPGKDIKDYDVIYFRRYNADLGRALAVAQYAKFHGVRIIDDEIAQREDSVTKLTQYMKMALNNVPIPATISAGKSMIAGLISRKCLGAISYPYIMKLADATRGNANELVFTQHQALEFLARYGEGEVLIQEYINNVGDYRVWVLGEEVGAVFYRTRNMGHKNNTSMGATIRQIYDDMPNGLFEVAIMAAKLFHREIAGVDVVLNSDDNSDLRIFEVNRAPQVEKTELEDVKAAALSKFLGRALEGAEPRTQADTIGVSSPIDFRGYKSFKSIPARIDTGARTSSLWASDVKIKNGIATFKMFGPGSQWYTGKVVRRKVIEQREVTSSTGHTEVRHLVAMSVRLHGKKLNAKFTLSDRSTQTYPILIGRNTLRGNFLVDSGDPGEARLYKYPEEANEFNESETL